MKHKRISITGQEPVSLEEARRQCFVTETDEDPTIVRNMKAARDYAEKETWRAITPGTFIAFADEFPDEIELPYPPLISIDKIEYKATNGTLTVLDPSEYEVDELSEPARIRPVNQWPTTKDGVYNAVQVTYSAGYAESKTPEGIRHAILMMIKHFYDNPEAVIASGGSIDVVEVPKGAQDLLNQESNRTFG